MRGVNHLSPRAQRRRHLVWIYLGAGIVLFAMLTALLGWLSGLRSLSIHDVTFTGNRVTPSRELAATTDATLSNRYLWLFSRRNVFIFPKAGLREDLLTMFPRLSSVSLNRNNFNDLEIIVTERKPVGLWCGVSVEAASTCYSLDERGFLFAIAPDFSGNSYIRYYGVLSKEMPLTSVFHGADFVRVRLFLDSLNDVGFTPLSFAVAEDGHYQIVLAGEGKILVSAIQDLAVTLANLKTVLNSDEYKKDVAAHKGKLQYLDLRFGNKVFYKFE